MYIVSACLLGENCRYNGGNNQCDWVKTALQGQPCLAVCPEVLGGLPTPRSPAELISCPEKSKSGAEADQPAFTIMDKEGTDVTAAFLLGAKRALEEAVNTAAALGRPIRLAILKANSPSCGCGMIYDGTFSGTLVPGDGVFAALLKDTGIPVITEKEEKLLR